MSKSNQLADILSKNLEDLKRAAFISLIRNRPSTTLAEVAELVEAEEMDQITIGDIIGDGEPIEERIAPVPAKGGKKKRAKKKPRRVAAKSNAKAPASSGDDEVNTRTKEGRDAYAAAVLACIQKDGAHHWSAQEVRAKVGGTANQARRALATHLGTKALDWEGNARATVYFLAE